MFCEYKNIFGKVNSGLHSYRIFNLAVVDVVFTIIGAFILCLLLPTYNCLNILLILFLIGIVFHRLFCVRTTIDTLLFSQPV